MTASSLQPRDGFLAVGLIARPWGIHGDMKVESLTDFPDRFAPGSRLWVQEVERVVVASRWQKGAVYLRFAGIDDPEAAAELRGAVVEVPEAERHTLADDEYYHYQLAGATVQTTAGETLGAVAEVLEPGGNAVLVVRGERGEVLLPFIDDVIKLVDLASGLIEVELMDGLLPEPSATRPPRPARAPRPRRRQPAPTGDQPASPD